MNTERQDALALDVPHSVAVVGCGGVGSWVALFLALAGVPELWLFDGDVVSAHNLNRVPFKEEDVGKSKTDVLQDLILSYRPECTVYSCGRFGVEVADGVELEEAIMYVVAATDTHASRKMIAEWAQEKGINYLEVAAEGEVGSVTGKPADWTSPLEHEPGYASVPVWLGPAVNAAVMVVSYIVHGAAMGGEVLRAGWDGSESKFTLYDSSAAEVTAAAELEEQHEQTQGADAATAAVDDIPF